MPAFLAHLPLYGAAAVVALLCTWLLKSSFVYINNESYGVVEKLWSFGGRHRAGFIALNGEPGFQPDVVLGGLHVFVPFMYKVHKQPMITVKGIAYVFARDGLPMTDGQVLGQFPETTRVEDARGFLVNKGQKGPQRYILREGIYAINTALFAVFTEEGTFTIEIGQKSEILNRILERSQAVSGFNPIVLDQDSVGVVTVNDGPSLEHGEIVAPTVGTDKNRPETFHNSFQAIERFLAAGGRRGRQEQVLVEGTYYINRLFATVEVQQKRVIGIGTVGVVNSYAGMRGSDVSGDDYTHGQLVETGAKGIWMTPLSPGKYAINPYAMSVKDVPTTNMVLRWEAGHEEAHGFDRNLKEVKLITKDAFEPVIGLAIVIHITPANAPFVIQQFSDIQKLVEQTLDTVVSSWFKDAVQEIKLIELISSRAAIQQKAFEEIGRKMEIYRIKIEQIMLGTPRSESGDKTIETIYNQLRDRQQAKEEMVTFAARQETAQSQRSFNEAKAIADNQPALTSSKIAIEIASNAGDAELAKRTREAKGVVVAADAEAQRIEKTGAADAKKIQAIGLSEAAAARAQVEAFGGAELALRKAMVEIVATAMAQSKQPVVPQVFMAGSEGGGAAGPGGGLPALLSAMFLGNGGIDRLIAPSANP